MRRHSATTTGDCGWPRATPPPGASASGPRSCSPRIARFAGADTRSSTHLAAAFELLHTAFLLHDDVIDHDLVRRGMPNVAGRFALDGVVARARSRHARTATARHPRSSPATCSSARRTVSSPASTRRRACATRCSTSSTSACSSPPRASTPMFGTPVPSPDERDILDMIERKTASYSFSAPLQAGALLGGASARHRRPPRRDRPAPRRRVPAARRRARRLRTPARAPASRCSATCARASRRCSSPSPREHADWSPVEPHFGSADLDEPAAARLRAAIESSGARARVERLDRRAMRPRRSRAIDDRSTCRLRCARRSTATVRECVERDR